MCDVMSFPATVDEFMEQYKIVDREEVYTNGAEMVPIFRMKQWFEHEALEKAPTALDHIHNVVRDDAYRRGYEQGKADANCPEIPDSCNVETVEAIPVPWIKARMEELESDGYMAEIGACGIKAILVQWEMEQKRN